MLKKIQGPSQNDHGLMARWSLGLQWFLQASLFNCSQSRVRINSSYTCLVQILVLSLNNCAVVGSNSKWHLLGPYYMPDYMPNVFHALPHLALRAILWHAKRLSNWPTMTEITVGVCSRLNHGPRKICSGPHPWNLWLWPYLENVFADVI